MKRVSALFLLVAFFVSFPACKVLDKLTQFHVTYDSQITIPKTLGIDLPIDVLTPDINSDSNSEFESNNTHKDLIDVIYPTEITLTITAPEESTFDFLKNIEIDISADGLAEKKIAWLDDIPKTGLKTITLNVSSDNLKAYILKDSFKLHTKTTTRELVSHDTDVSIHTTFFVNAKILGV
jgi:hypothetical protein